jgi:hypothetical protein
MTAADFCVSSMTGIENNRGRLLLVGSRYTSFRIACPLAVFRMLYPFDIPVTGLRQINLISEIQLATSSGCSWVTAFR